LYTRASRIGGVSGFAGNPFGPILHRSIDRSSMIDIWEMSFRFSFNANKRRNEITRAERRRFAGKSSELIEREKAMCAGFNLERPVGREISGK